MHNLVKLILFDSIQFYLFFESEIDNSKEWSLGYACVIIHEKRTSASFWGLKILTSGF